jgi:folylpolyglutamate synthase/dihydropteroate synthase
MIEALLPCASTVIFTEAQNERAVSNRELAPLVPESLTTGSLEEALDLARRHARPGEPIVVTGSLFLVGEARALLVAEGTAARPLPSR